MAISPGPGVFYIVTRSVTQGKRLGLASVAGVACGNFGNALGASFGLATVFVVSALAFSVVKYAGAAYLIYLGVKALSSPASKPDDPALPKSVFLRKTFTDGFIVALLNPKTAMFYVAFLPQFVDAPEHALAQTLLLSGIFVLIAATTDSIYALAAGTIRPWLFQKPAIGKAGKYLAGSAFIGLGILAATSSYRRK